jgi:hypothetical protein
MTIKEQIYVFEIAHHLNENSLVFLNVSSNQNWSTTAQSRQLQKTLFKILFCTVNFRWIAMIRVILTRIVSRITTCFQI